MVGRRLPAGPGHWNLDDEMVSGRHARLTLDGDGIWIEDLNSANGTWVDGKRIKEKTLLDPSSIIRLGRTMLHLEAGLSSAPALMPSPGKQKTPEPFEPPAEVVAGDESMPNLVLDGAAPDAARERLTAVCELTAALSEIDSVDTLSFLLLEHLHRAFASFGRNLHSGLLMGPELILKAYRPESDPPTCSLTLGRHVLSEKKACLWRLGVQGDVDPSMSLMAAGTTSAMYAPLIWSGEVYGVVYFDATSGTKSFEKDDLRLVQLMATQTAIFIKNLQLGQVLQREAAIKSRLLAQFPPSIAERLARLPDHTSIPSERLDRVTVLISDVRGFTKLAAAMEPEAVVRMLNDMFHELTPIVLKHNGTVDKYIGDALLAVFGCPEADDQQDEHAIQAALEMQESIHNLETKRWRGRTPFRIGIAVHTGPAIHGFIGAPERMEYTVVGNTINITSRYCDAAAPGEILVSPQIYQRLHYCLDVEHPPLEVETKHEGLIKAYVVRGWKGSRAAKKEGKS
ncbi:MAG: FHA domain-containing protein [Candidatus Aminicenantes bacterium]|nr:FHA domain-containing protein [Candidatus Aminicenantes bacterium]